MLSGVAGGFDRYVHHGAIEDSCAARSEQLQHALSPIALLRRAQDECTFRSDPFYFDRQLCQAAEPKDDPWQFCIELKRVRSTSHVHRRDR
ncbi:hypothetical protein ASC67_05135 [Methylibium sp. Root1272]|nr:hypothetical protein ASC67_05135 [Methylibium sp. Root1272]